MMPLMISSAGAVIMHLISVFSYEAAGRPEQIIGSICIPLLAGVLTIGVCRAAKAHIGDGDGYLLASLFVIIGVRDGISAVLTTFCAVSVYAGVRYIAGRKRFAMSVPFAPFVMTGFMVTLLNGI